MIPGILQLNKDYFNYPGNRTVLLNVIWEGGETQLGDGLLRCKKFWLIWFASLLHLVY